MKKWLKNFIFIKVKLFQYSPATLEEYFFPFLYVISIQHSTNDDRYFIMAASHADQKYLM